MLVVISIIGILVGLLLPAINSARESGRRNSCSNQIGQLAKAITNYETAHGTFPPGRLGCDASTTGVPGYQTTGASGFLAILPQLDNGPLYQTLVFIVGGTGSVTVPIYPAVLNSTSSGWYNLVASTGTATTTTTPSVAQSLLARPGVFVCPSDTAGASNTLLTPPTTTSSYALVLGSLGASTTAPMLDQNGNVLVPAQPIADEPHQKYYNNGPFIYLLAHRSGDVRDGLSNTMFIGETTGGDLPESMNSWPLSVAYLSSMRSTNNKLNPQPNDSSVVSVTIINSGLSGVDGQSVTGAFASRHPSGANFAFGDSHVRYIANQIDFPTYQALSTIAGGEPINPSLIDLSP
jgi:prepilin-type processing-associated H-X9-DG protein